MAQRDGSVEHLSGGVARLTFLRHYDHPTQAVWAMLTDPAQIEKWWARANVLDLTGGGQVELQWLNSDEEGLQPLAKGKVSALDQLHIVEYNTDVFGALRFVLTPTDNGTDLAFTATLPLEPAWEQKMLAGWHWRFDALADALNGQAVDWPNWPQKVWVSHKKRYAEKLSWGG